LFKGNLIALIEMDSRVDLLEWSLQKILFSHLDAQFFELAPIKARYSDPGQLGKEIELMLSVIARAGAENQCDREEAFGAVAQVLGLSGLALLARDRIKVSDLAFAPEIARLAIQHCQDVYPQTRTSHGFVGSFNPTCPSPPGDEPLLETSQAHPVGSRAAPSLWFGNWEMARVWLPAGILRLGEGVCVMRYGF
jgi:hypothetical protein